MREGRSDGCDTGGIFQGATEQVLSGRYACCQEHKCIERGRLKPECQIPMREKYCWYRSILINTYLNFGLFKIYLYPTNLRFIQEAKSFRQKYLLPKSFRVSHNYICIYRVFEVSSLNAKYSYIWMHTKMSNSITIDKKLIVNGYLDHKEAL